MVAAEEMDHKKKASSHLCSESRYKFDALAARRGREAGEELVDRQGRVEPSEYDDARMRGQARRERGSRTLGKGTQRTDWWRLMLQRAPGKSPRSQGKAETTHSYWRPQSIGGRPLDEQDEAGEFFLSPWRKRTVPGRR